VLVDTEQSKVSLVAAHQLVRDFIENTSEDADAADVLTRATQQVAQSLNARACTVRLVEGDTLSVGVAWGYKNPASRAHAIRIDERLHHLVYDREVLQIPDIEADAFLPASRRERMRLEGFRAYLGVPMVASCRVEGVLSLYYPTPRAFVEDNVACLRALADCLALGVQRTRWFERATRQTDGACHATKTQNTVLVVDDHPAVGVLLERILRGEGYEPVIFRSGQEALRFLETHSVQMVITDLNLSDASGWQVARAAKQKSPQTRVMMITSSCSDLTPQHLRDNRVDFLLPKPFSLSSLMMAIATLAGKRT
jgi:CheY-like chemotaxis protein